MRRRARSLSVEMASVKGVDKARSFLARRVHARELDLESLRAEKRRSKDASAAPTRRRDDFRSLRSAVENGRGWRTSRPCTDFGSTAPLAKQREFFSSGAPSH